MPTRDKSSLGVIFSCLCVITERCMLNIIILLGIAVFGSSLFMALFRMAIPKKEVNKHESKLKEYKFKKLFYGVPSLLIAGGALVKLIEINFFSNLSSSYIASTNTAVVGVVFALIAITISQVNRLDDKIELLEEKIEENKKS